jgi:hypothetical protein
MNNSANFHAVIGSVLRAPMQVFFVTARTKNGAPSARTGITFAGAIGINNDMG